MERERKRGICKKGAVLSSKGRGNKIKTTCVCVMDMVTVEYVAPHEEMQAIYRNKDMRVTAKKTSRSSKIGSRSAGGGQGQLVKGAIRDEDTFRVECGGVEIKKWRYGKECQRQEGVLVLWVDGIGRLRHE